MIRTASFRELKPYSRQEILQSINVPEKIGNEIIARLLRSNVLKIRSESVGVITDELRSSDIAIGDVKIAASEKRYIFDYVGLLEVSIGNSDVILTCFPKYIKKTEASFTLQDMRLFVRTIERYSNAKQFTVSISSDNEERTHYNPLAIAIFLLRDYWEHGIYVNTKNILEKNGTGEIEWDATIEQTIPLLRDGRPFYIDYFTSETTADESNYITRLHECLLSEYSRHLREIGLDDLFDIETVELYEGNLSDFGDIDYIEQRILQEINVQFVTHKQILLRAIYALIHKTGHSEEDSGLNLYGTNSFHRVWENVCSEVFASQLNTPVKNLPMPLNHEYKNTSVPLLELIPKPKWRNCKNGIEKDATKTLIPDYISVYNKEGVLYFVIMDAKYYDINLPPHLAGNPGVDDVDKQYLYQLAYKDFIEKHHLIAVNAFLCPGDIETFNVAGEVEMPIFAGLGLANIKVVILSATKMLEAYLSGKQLDLHEELGELFS